MPCLVDEKILLELNVPWQSLNVAHPVQSTLTNPDVGGRMDMTVFIQNFGGQETLVVTNGAALPGSKSTTLCCNLNNKINSIEIALIGWSDLRTATKCPLTLHRTITLQDCAGSIRVSQRLPSFLAFHSMTALSVHLLRGHTLSLVILVKRIWPAYICKSCSRFWSTTSLQARQCDESTNMAEN